MITKGRFIFWEMSEIKTTVEQLTDLGFAEFVPRNDYKTTLIKALKQYTKGNEKLYRGFNGDNDTIKYSVFVEHIDESGLDLKKEITIKLNKRTGALENAPEKLAEIYRSETNTIDTTQLRQLILKSLRKNSHAVPMRSGGGIYFVDERFSQTLEKVRNLFNVIEGSKMYEVPVYNESTTLDAIEDAVASEIYSDIESIIHEVKRTAFDGTLTDKRLTSRLDEADQIIKKIKVHEDNLRSKASFVGNKVKTLKETLQNVHKEAKSALHTRENLIDMLANI